MKLFFGVVEEGEETCRRGYTPNTQVNTRIRREKCAKIW